MSTATAAGLSISPQAGSSSRKMDSAIRLPTSQLPKKMLTSPCEISIDWRKLDSVFGAALGGILIGVVENLSEGYIGRGMKEIAGFVLILVVLMVRPYGLFGKPDIERV